MHIQPRPILTYIHMYNICMYVYAFVYMHLISTPRSHTYTMAPRKRVPTRVKRAHRRCRPRTTGRAASKPGRARPERLRWRAAGPEGGAYRLHVRHGRGVPRADVHVERRRLAERLRAEPHAVHADGMRSYGSARIRVRPHPHPQARTHARSTCTRTWRAHASAIRSSM